MSLDTELALLGGAGDLDRARRKVAELPVAVRQYHGRGMATAVEFAIAMIADEAPDPDAVLFSLLGACLADHRRAQQRAGRHPGRPGRREAPEPRRLDQGVTVAVAPGLLPAALRARTVTR